MEPLQQLEKIHNWFESGDAYKLIEAYRERHYREAGTTGIYTHEKEKPAVIDERGVLHPERFEEYMLALQTRVKRALESKQILRRAENMDLTMPLLLSTLEQMIASVTVPQEIGQLFDKGKEASRDLREYFQETERGHMQRPDIKTAYSPFRP